MPGELMDQISILVVEDNNDLREILCIMLRNENFAVIAAEDVARASEFLMQFKPSIILTDLHMPFASGTDLIRHVRSTPELSNIPIIAMTAFHGGKYLEEAKSAGASLILKKPVDYDALVLSIRGVMGGKAAGTK